MRIEALMLALCLAGALHAGAVFTTEMPSGAWEILPAAKVEPYAGPDCFYEKWAPLKRAAGDELVSWFLPAAHPKHGRPISVFVLMGDDNGWQRDAQKARRWLSGAGEGQKPFIVVCAPDVTQLVDPNAVEYHLWLAVEYADGARLPFYGEAFPNAKPIGDTKVEPWAVRLPQGYALDGTIKRDGNEPKPMKNDEGRVATRDQTPEFKGRAWSWLKWTGVEKGEGGVLVSWPPAPADPEAGSVVKYLLFLGNLDAPVFNDQVERVASWLGCRGDRQWDRFIECDKNVTQLLDLNKEKYRLFLAVEYENGKRVGYQGKDCPRVETYSEAMISRLSRNVYRAPIGYGRPQPPEMIDIRDRVAVYLKEGRSWTTRNTMKLIGKGETVTLTRIDILRVGENEVEYQSTELGEDGKSLPGTEPSSLKLPLKVPKPKSPTAVEPSTPETITVKAGTFECLRTQAEYSGTRTTTWTSTKHPGLIVKQTSLSDTIDSTQELVEFKD